MNYEDKLQRELNIARRVKGTRSGNFAKIASLRRSCGGPIGTSPAAADYSGRRKCWRICEIECLSAELEIHSLSDHKRLEHRKVHQYWVAPFIGWKHFDHATGASRLVRQIGPQ